MEVEIVCPDDCAPGDTISIQTEDGELEVEVPEGIEPGDTFEAPGSGSESDEGGILSLLSSDDEEEEFSSDEEEDELDPAMAAMLAGAAPAPRPSVRVEPEPEPAPEPEVEPEPEPEPEPAVTEASAVRSIAGFGKQAHTLQSRHTELQSELDTLLASSDEEEQQPEPEAPAPEPSPVLPRPSTVPVLNLSLIQPDMRHHDARTRAEESGASRKRSDRPRSRAEWHRAKIRGGRSYTGSRGSGSADGDQAQQQGSRLKRIESFDGGTFDPE